MAKAGFRIMDSDIHVLEPHDLWVRYMEPGFREQAPRFAPLEGSAYEGWQFDGTVFTMEPMIAAVPATAMPAATGW